MTLYIYMDSSRIEKSTPVNIAAITGGNKKIK